MNKQKITTICRDLVNSPNSKVYKKYILFFLVFTSFLSAFLLYPMMPIVGLDPSWGYGMKEALIQDLAIGKDIIFTYGPYTALRTGLFHPDGSFIEASAAIYLAFCYTVAIIILSINVKLSF